MTFTEANKIYKIWSQWFWPSHFILHTIFLSKIPASFLPYPQDTLEEALNLVANKYYNSGDYQTSKDIQGSIACLIGYVEDKDALEQAAESFTNPKVREVMLTYISNFKNDQNKWVEKQED